MDNFYLYLNEQQEGLFTLQQLKQMWTVGRVTAKTLYWQEGLTEWLPLSTMGDAFEPPRRPAITLGNPDEPVRCPKCESSQVTANKKGFDLKGAIIGDLLIGPLGLLRGFRGATKS